MSAINLKSEVATALSIFDKHAHDINDLFTAFPRGSCGNASLLLGDWLSSRGFKNIGVVLGKKRWNKSFLVGS